MEEKKSKSKVITVMLVIALLCVVCLLAIALFYKDSIFGGNNNNPEQKETPKEEQKDKPVDYTGKYQFESVNTEDPTDKTVEYFVLNADGTATVNAVTGDGNTKYETINTKYTITTENGKTILKFSEYSAEEPLNWYTYAIELNGTKAIPTEYNTSCTGPSECPIEFEKVN